MNTYKIQIIIVLILFNSCSITKNQRYYELNAEYYGFVYSDYLSRIVFEKDGTFVLDWEKNILNGTWSRIDNRHLYLRINPTEDFFLSQISAPGFRDERTIAILEPKAIRIKGIEFGSRLNNHMLMNWAHKKDKSYCLIKAERSICVNDTACYILYREEVFRLLSDKDDIIKNHYHFVFLDGVYCVLGVLNEDNSVSLYYILTYNRTIKPILSFSSDTILKLFRPVDINIKAINHCKNGIERYFVLFDEEGHISLEYDYRTVDIRPFKQKYIIDNKSITYLETLLHNLQVEERERVSCF